MKRGCLLLSHALDAAMPPSLLKEPPPPLAPGNREAWPCTSTCDVRGALLIRKIINAQPVGGLMPGDATSCGCCVTSLHAFATEVAALSLKYIAKTAAFVSDAAERATCSFRVSRPWAHRVDQLDQRILLRRVRRLPSAPGWGKLGAPTPTKHRRSRPAPPIETWPSTSWTGPPRIHMPN